MKNILKGLLLIALIAAVSFLMPGLMDSTEYTILADEAEWSESGSGEEEVDKFTIVEIVPYKGMGEIGYLIGDQEPVDQELMPYNNANGLVSFLGGAINVYRSYIESDLPASGEADSGWRPAKTITNQNGYFVPSSDDNEARYRKVTGDNYIRVADGTGNYRIELTPGTEMDDVYGPWDPTNRKNVKAYFVYGKPAGVTLFSSNLGYDPYSVTKNTEHTGDYDYDSATERFILNQDHGKYDVIFARSYSAHPYYMMDNYQIVEDNTGDYSFPVRYVAQTGGNYMEEAGNKYYAYDRWNGNYSWVQDEAALTKPSNYYTEGDKTWVSSQKIIKEYQYTSKTQLVNNEWIKRLTLGIPSNQVDNYTVEVITITPEDLNLAQNQHYIDEADMFYLNANYGHNQSYIMLYEKYSQEGLDLPYDSKYDDGQNNKRNNLNFAVHDLDWPSVEKIFKRVAGIGCNKAAMVVDSTFYNDAVDGNGAYAALSKSVTVSYSWNSNKATMCNLAKLYIMVYQRNMVDFYNSFLNPLTTNYRITQVGSTINRTGVTGSFIRPDSTNPSPTADAAVYWNGNTFVPYGLNSEGVMVRFAQDKLVENGIVNYNIYANPTDLTANVLSIGGSDIFTSKFIQTIYLPDDAEEDAILHDDTSSSSGGFTLSDITNIITNGGAGYENTGGVSYPGGGGVEGVPSTAPVGDTDDASGLREYKRVLNIQPTADFTASEASIRKILKSYSYNLQIINMTSTQFNGSMEDINAKYDMVYMGSGNGRFNLAKTWDSIKTVFNDYNSAIENGMIYFSIGDAIRINDGTERKDFYRGNDITPMKRGELNSFLEAGYPVVLDENLYSKEGIQSGTNINRFITDAKTSGRKNLLNLENYTDNYTYSKITFLINLSNALNITRPMIKLISPVLAEDAPVNYIYVNPSTDLLTIQFALLPKKISSSGKYYNTYLYIDLNGDGIFDESSEKIMPVSSNGESLNHKQEDRFKSYTINYNMSNKNGVYQWKLVSEREDNIKIRSLVTGYVANTRKENINILHIRDNISTYSLQSRINDTASLIKLYAGNHVLKDYNLVFTTISVAEFQEQYTREAYPGEDASITNKLSKYHLLILDNPNSEISSNDGALQNIKDELANNLGVIYTKGALGYSNQMIYNNSKSNFLEYQTYNYLNRFALPTYYSRDQYYIYNSMGTSTQLGQDVTYQTTFLTKTNEGAITRYPYQISKAIKIEANSYSKDVTSDFESTGSKKLIGWYSLSDSKSPVVRNAGLYTTGTDEELYKGVYSSSPNDVKNNYYLFSNGLCYFTGLRLATADIAGNDDEIKLFINTIIAAHKASGRVIMIPSVITITDPVPIVTGTTQSITVTPEDITGDDFILTFNIAESSSNMDLTIGLGSTEPHASWQDTIYEVKTDGTLGTGILINNHSKVVENLTYAVKIPKTAIVGTHELTFTAINAQGSSTTANVTLNYDQKPIITIMDPIPINNTSASTGFLYVDIDYNSLDTEESYLNTQKLRVEFKVEQVFLTTFKLDVSSVEDNLRNGIGDDELLIYALADDKGTEITYDQLLPNGDYVMYLPMNIMKNYNSKEIILTAKDHLGTEGKTSITLLRRSLFPLD